MLDLEKETPVRTLSPPQSYNNYYLKALNLTSLQDSKKEKKKKKKKRETHVTKKKKKSQD